uniref:Uncharacterized protein n=1 Tax=Amphiprion percula TaxID=161767 RepID=A0A3P8S7G4_AMPPE
GISLITPSHLLLPQKVILLWGAGTADVSTACSIGHFVSGRIGGEETDHNMTVSNILNLLLGINIRTRNCNKLSKQISPHITVTYRLCHNDIISPAPITKQEERGNFVEELGEFRNGVFHALGVMICAFYLLGIQHVTGDTAHCNG